MNAAKEMVTHPAGGIYLSKFMAGIVSAVMVTAMVGAFGNLWYLNRKAIEFQLHVDHVEKSDVITRPEFEAEKRLWQSELKDINDKLADLKQAIKDQRNGQ